MAAEEISKESFEQKKDETWAQTIRKGDITESIRVEKLDNEGYLVVLERYGYEKGDKKHQKYISSTKKLFSEINPLDTDETDNLILKVSKMLTKEK